jgi:hypothetical protein
MDGGVMAWMLIENAFCAELEAESFAWTVKLKTPAACGFPLINPPELSDTPPGNDPADTVHEYGADPPEAASVCEYADPAVPDGKGDEVKIVTGVGAGAIVIENAFCAEPDAESLTWIVKLNAPAVCGVPLISPDVLSESPPGNDPATTLHEYGAVPPEALRACE